MNNQWKQVALSEITSVSAGNSAPQDPSYFAEGTIPFFRTSDAGRVKFGTIYESQDKLNTYGASKLRRYPAGTILFPKSGASTFLNHRVVLGVEGCVSSHLATIVPDLSHVLPQFLLYALALIDAKDLIQDQSYPSLNLPAIEKICINLPPLAEQQRIVRLLDEAFEGMATAETLAEQKLAMLKQLKASLLAQAFAGELKKQR
jgi:type I restriction enzyme S subunit